MAMRNAVSVSIIVVLSTFLFSCGGGNTGPDDILNGPPNNCDKPQTFDGNNPTLPHNAQNGEVTANHTLASGCYLIDRQILVKENAILYIEPKTTLLFTSKAGLTANGGGIMANGTSDKAIYFTSQVHVPGSWIGIRINERSQASSVFNNVVIEYAGNSGFDATRPTYSFGVININRADNIGRVSFTNSVIRKSAGEYAFYAERKSYFEQIENNKIFDNNGYPIHIHSNEVQFLTQSNSVSYKGVGNVINKIFVIGNRIDTSKAAEAYNLSGVTWSNLGVPYLINEDILVFNTNMTLEAGLKVQFASDAGLGISEPNASLNAKGTANNPILLTLDDAFVTSNGLQNAFWKGLRFYNASSLQNRLEYTTIEYGGNITNQQLQSNLFVGKNSQININQSKFRLSGGYGLQLEEESIVPEFHNNILTQNQHGAAKVSSTAVRYLDPSSNYSGNLRDYIEVVDGGLNGGDVWQGLNVPYAFFKHFFVDRSLTLEAGTTLIFGENIKIEITGALSSLVVNGTGTNRVNFTSASQYINPGLGNTYWQGIIFKNSPGSPINQIDNAIIEYAGSPQSFSAPQPAALMLDPAPSNKDSRVNIRNTTISNVYPGSWGVFKKQDESTLVEDSNANNNLFSRCVWQVTGICSSF